MSSPRIDEYHFGQLKLAGRVYEQDLIILPARVYPDWWREEGHQLRRADLALVFEAAPELLVVGTGAYDRMKITAACRQELRTAGIELVSKPTAAAVEYYNVWREKKVVAAALHLTC